MGKKIILHFFNEEEAKKFKESWNTFSTFSYGSITQEGKTCIVDYNCKALKKGHPLPNSIFRGGCTHCG